MSESDFLKYINQHYFLQNMIIWKIWSQIIANMIMNFVGSNPEIQLSAMLAELASSLNN